MKECN